MNVYHMSGKIQLYTVHAKWSGITTGIPPIPPVNEIRMFNLHATYI